MIEKYLVTIISANEKQKTDEQSFECEDLVAVSRVLLTFKAKRNYEFVTCHIDKVGVLV